MRHSVTIQQPENKKTELYPIVTGVGFLALVTGLLYLGVIIGEILPLLGSDNMAWASVSTALLLLSGTAGLALSWKWEKIGGLLALLSGWALLLLLAFTADTYPIVLAVLYSSPFILAGALWLAHSAMSGRRIA